MQAVNKLLKFTPATKNVASIGRRKAQIKLGQALQNI